MNANETLFIHALARFRSSQSMSTVERWSALHNYDLALALSEAADEIIGLPIPFFLVRRAIANGLTDTLIAIEVDDAPCDVFGTNLRLRLMESFDENGTQLNEKRIHTKENLFMELDALDFFSSYWPPEDGWKIAIRDGILSAATELAAA